MLYVRPSDRPYRSDYASAIQNVLPNIQSWYRDQLGGKTFHLHTAQPEPCALPHDSAYYLMGSWTKVLADVQGCAPVGYASPTVTWVLYVDVLDSCNDPGRLGAGTLGITMLPRTDLDGLVGQPVTDRCGWDASAPLNRWIGGLGHELGHALGLLHPPGCDASLPTCDYGALMWTGFYSYPSAYLRPDDRATLLASVFIR